MWVGWVPELSWLRPLAFWEPPGKRAWRNLEGGGRNWGKETKGREFGGALPRGLKKLYWKVKGLPPRKKVFTGVNFLNH